jgi:methylenetetrahydrofolate reductase (NADPH)
MTVPTALDEVHAMLLDDFSLEMTGKDIEALEQARGHIPAGTRVNITYLAHEDLSTRVAAARAVREAGLVPVPHISARRLASHDQLEEFLDALVVKAAVDQVLVIAGDPPAPEGPFADSLAVIETGALRRHGIRGVAVAGHPEGLPHVTEDVLWRSLREKSNELRDDGFDLSLVTQFCFDTDTVLTWVEQVRAHGVDAPIRIGVPGPATVRRLMTYASRFGIGTSRTIVKKYGLSLANLMHTAGPERMINSLVEGYDAERHGALRLHFFTFGGIESTSDWIAQYRRIHG